MLVLKGGRQYPRNFVAKAINTRDMRIGKDISRSELRIVNIESANQ